MILFTYPSVRLFAPGLSSHCSGLFRLFV